MQRRLRRHRPIENVAQSQRKRRGGVCVEFALTAPIFFMLVFAQIEFARINMIRHGIDSAVYEGARRGIVPGATADDVKAVARQTLDAVKAYGANVSVQPPVLSKNVREITVSVTVPLAQNGWVIPRFVKDKQLTKSYTLARENSQGI
jgi:Flp pilus assembly protein TadG